MLTATERARLYQAWCRSRAGGSGKADAHFHRDSDEDGVACVATDHAFMDDQIEEQDDRCLPNFVHKFFEPRWVTSHVVEHNGADEWATTAATLESDGELSIGALEARSRQEG